MGAFDVTIEGRSYLVAELRVWSSGPGGTADGFEFRFKTGIDSAFLSLRSSQEIYLLPLVPEMVDLAQMDLQADIFATTQPPGAIDAASILHVPEAASATSGLAAIGTLAAGARRRRSRRIHQG